MILELGQRFDAFEWIRVTAEYSNAVLVAVLPYVSNAVERLDLPVPRPVTMEQVTYCNVAPRRMFSVGIGIKGGWDFLFSRGYIDTIQSSHSYFVLQDPDNIPEYYGQVRMTKAEAIELGRETIRRLGIPLESVFAEQEPRVTEPEKIGTNVVPHYRIEWLSPRGGLVSPVDIDINADRKRVERLCIFNKSLEKPPPKIDIVPPPEPRGPKPWPHTNPEYARQLISIALRAVDEYAEKLSLPIPRPLTTNHVAVFSLADNGGWPHAEIELTNGWHFVYRNSMVNGYYAPDDLFSIRSEQHPILIKDFLGQWNMTEAEALELIRKTIAKLGYPNNLTRMDFAPKVIKPAIPGIPRYHIWWWCCEDDPSDDLISKVEAEVDADKRELKSLYFDHKSFWNKPPPIDVPISLPSNR